MNHRSVSSTQYKISGFTLIELLVVVAIIALLAAILFPVFGRARENARRSSCASNMKQMGLALSQYSQDYDERLCPFSQDLDGSGVNRSWRILIQPYVKSGQMFVCPSNPNSTDIQEAKTALYPEVRTSYAGNWINDGSSDPGHILKNARTLGVMGRGGYPGVQLAEIAFPSQCIMVSECLRLSSQFDVTDTSTMLASTATSCQVNGGTDYSCLFAGHLETSNFLFVDGHVKSLKPISTLNPTAGATQTGNMWFKSGLGMTGTTYTYAKTILGTSYGLD